MIYDITADQYDYSSVYCGKYDSFHRGLSLNEIAKTLHASKHSVSMVCSRAAAKGLTQQRVDEIINCYKYKIYDISNYLLTIRIIRIIIKMNWNSERTNESI